MTWTPDQPFQTLALTGGGYRGLFTARALQRIEEKINEPIGRRFDLITGTSIGGIVALAAAFEVSMADVVKVFDEEGKNIFPPHDPPTTKVGKAWDLYCYARTPRYASSALRKAVMRLIPADCLLGDALHPVAIPAVNLSQGKPQVFKTRHKEEWDRDRKFKAVDVALATSAAPTFFELAELDGNRYADGGLFANAPDLVGIHEAEHYFGVAQNSMRMLSIGTTTSSYSVSFSAGREFGIADWMEGQRLFSVIISSQQQFVGQVASHRLAGNYFRLDYEPSHEQCRDLGLDVATDVAKKTLLAFADKAVSDVLGTKLVPYLSHQPQLKIVN